MHPLTYPLTTHAQVMKYAENIAEEYLAHVPGDERKNRFCKTFDDLQSLNRNGIVLCVAAHPLRYDGDYDNVHRIMRYEWLLMQSIGTDLSKAEEAIEACTALHDKILTRLAYDSDPLRLTNRVFTYFRWNEITTDIYDEPRYTDGMVGISSVVPLGSNKSFIFN